MFGDFFPFELGLEQTEYELLEPLTKLDKQNQSTVPKKMATGTFPPNF